MQAPPTIAQDSLLQGGMFMHVCGVDTQNRILQKFVRLEIMPGKQINSSHLELFRISYFFNDNRLNYSIAMHPSHY